MKINLLYDNSLDCWNAIKLSALYFEETDISTQMALRMDTLTQEGKLEDFKINEDGTFHTPFVMDDKGRVENYRVHKLYFSDKRVNSQFNALSEAGIIKFVCTHQSFGGMDMDTKNKIRDYIYENLDKIFDGLIMTKENGKNTKIDFSNMRLSDSQTNENMYILEKALKETTDYYRKKYPNSGKAFITNVVDLYFLIICDFYNKLCLGINTISSNNFVNHIIQLIHKDMDGHRKKSGLGAVSKVNAIPIFLPNFYEMCCEDILELRYFAKDELDEMRFYIHNLSSTYAPDDSELIDANMFLESKIKPAIKTLESKVYGLKAGTIQKALKELKNPFSYTPLLTSFFIDISSHIALATSMGLIAADVGIEYLKQKKSIEADPLYFSVKLKDIAKNKIGIY